MNADVFWAVWREILRKRHSNLRRPQIQGFFRVCSVNPRPNSLVLVSDLELLQTQKQSQEQISNIAQPAIETALAQHIRNVLAVI